MTKFKVGDTVKYKDDDVRGEILEVRDDNVETGPKYLIKYLGTHWLPDWEHEDNLELWDHEEEKRLAAEIQAKVDEAQSAMEKAWEAYSQAKEMAYQSKGYSGMWSLTRAGLVNLGKFEAVAENFGWSASSLYCLIMRETLKAVRAARRALAKFAKELPDLDAHSSTFCIANDAVEYLDRVLKDLPVYMKEAKKLAKKNPNWPGKKRF